MEDSRRFGMSKLNEDNYHVWQQRTELWLRKEDLWDVIESTPPTTPDSGWSKRDRQARATIGLLIDDKYLSDIKHENTARGTWYKLYRIHSHNTLGTRLMLYRKIFSARYVPGSNMNTHITDILDAASKLEDAGYKLLDELVCSALLGSLPREYDVLITTIEGRDAGDITIEYVREKIIEENKKQERRTTDRETEETALLTQSRLHPRTSQNPPKCFYCHKVGHIRRDCRMLKRHNVHSEFTNRATNDQDHTRLMRQHDNVKAESNQPINITDNSYMTASYRAFTLRSATNSQQAEQWVIDTGAAEHMSSNIHLLHNVQTSNSPSTVVTASGEHHTVTHRGDYCLNLIDSEQREHRITLTQVLLVPSLTESLISVAKLDEEGYSVRFAQRKSWLHKDDEQMLLGSLQGNLYIHEPQENHTADKSNLCRHIWHNRLGHRNTTDIERMSRENMVEGLKINKCENTGICTPCTLAKMTKAPFPTNKHKQSTGPFQTIYSDLCGPITPESLGHNAYILTFTDEFSKFSHTYMLRFKHYTTNCIKDYIEKGINKFGHRPQIFFSDGGGEYNNGQLAEYLSQKGIHHLNSLPYSPQENGQAERYNRTLLETTRTLLKQSKLPDYLWAELANTSTYLLNRVGRQQLQKTPYELWHGHRPKVDHLRDIGSTCYFYNPSPHKKKLDDRGIQGTLVGYGESTSFYRIWESTSGKIYQSRKVIFPQEKCPQQPVEDHLTISLDVNRNCNEASPTTIHDDKQDHALRRSRRANLGKAPTILTYDHLGESSPATRDWHNRNIDTAEQHESS